MRKQEFHTTLPLEEFFQNDSESALQQRVAWLAEHADLPYSFFSHLLGVTEPVFVQWARGRGQLREAQQDTLREFWGLHMRILGLFDFDTKKAQRMYRHVDHTSTTAYASLPPWKGTSLRSYMEAHGKQGIRATDEWLNRLRFAEPY